MAKRIGPSFLSEFLAAGLGGAPVAWGADSDSITGRELLSPAQIAALDAVIAAHDPTKSGPLNDRVNAERDRRIALGSSVDVGTALAPKVIPFDMRNDDDFRNLNGLATAALARITTGDPTSFPFRDAANALHALAPSEMLAVAMGAAGWVSAHYQAAWAIKDAAAPPADVTADALWPQRPA